jgi:hypothetical protein
MCQRHTVLAKSDQLSGPRRFQLRYYNTTWVPDTNTSERYSGMFCNTLLTPESLIRLIHNLSEFNSYCSTYWNNSVYNTLWAYNPKDLVSQHWDILDWRLLPSRPCSLKLISILTSTYTRTQLLYCNSFDCCLSILKSQYVTNLTQSLNHPLAPLLAISWSQFHLTFTWSCQLLKV